MRIAIDVRFALGKRTGVVNYLINLVENLAGIDDRNEYFLYIHGDDTENRLPQKNNFHKRIIKAPLLLWKNVYLPLSLRRDKIDIFHSPSYTLPLASGCKTIVTIHDVMHEINPDWFSMKDLFLLKGPIRFAVKRATRIIAVSENTKADIVKFYDIPREKISVTYEGVSEVYRPIADRELLESVHKKYNINTEFILYVGVLFIRRNIPNLIKAFQLLKRNHRLPHKLVIVGANRNYFDLNKLIVKEKLEGEVISTDHIPDEDLPLMYNAAEMFVYPSFYEGFGLPILEAMACGTPVITSRNSSLAEIAGDAALLVNPYNVEELSQAMLSLSDEQSLSQRLSRDGLSRVRDFSWRRMAEQTLAIYREVYANKNW